MYTILGASGFIGSHLRRHLEATGQEVHAPRLGRNGGGIDIGENNGDLGHVIYCIGLTADYLADPIATVEAHVSILAEVLRHGRFQSLVYLSSTRLYDSGGPVGHEADDLQLNPRNRRHLYDLSKAAGESLCLSLANPAVRVARLSCVYAEDLGAENFLHDLVRRSAREPFMRIETALDYARDYVHIDDAIAALIAIGETGLRPIYNVASGENVTNRELFAMIERMSGCRIQATEASANNLTPTPRISVAALRDDLGIAPARLAPRLPRMIEAQAELVL